MSRDPSIESLFKEHSLEEIETVRDSLAGEIEKRTELLKSIVKEKYRDIVETTDAIQSMKVNLRDMEQSIWSLDKSISEFYVNIREPVVETDRVAKILRSPGKEETSANLIKRLFRKNTEIWDNFDNGDYKTSIKLLNESLQELEKHQDEVKTNHPQLANNLTITLNRTKEMIKNNLWYTVEKAAPDQIGIIAGTDQEDVYQLSLDSSIEVLVKKLRDELRNSSFRAQIRRYQTWSHFNTQTNQIEPNVEPGQAGLVQIPKLISIELSSYLYKVCKVVNTIAGFNLSRSSIVDSLRITIEHALKVYEEVIEVVNTLQGERKRKRASQLYYDLLYLRILLNTSKNVDLIERLDPKVMELASKYEKMLDSIELYTVAAALHSNVVTLSQCTIRLYGLLIPHLQ